MGVQNIKIKETQVKKYRNFRVLGISPDCMFKFQKITEAENMLKLDFWAHIKDVTEVQAKTGKKNFQLEIDYTNIN